MCYAGILTLWIGAAALIGLLSRLVTRWTGVAALGRLGHALSLAIVAGAVAVRVASGPVDCYGLCWAVDLGVYPWWLAYMIGCTC
jgi:hypothetical protein